MAEPIVFKLTTWMVVVDIPGCKYSRSFHAKRWSDVLVWSQERLPPGHRIHDIQRALIQIAPEREKPLLMIVVDSAYQP